VLDAEVVDGRASPTPIRVVLLGRTQVVGMTMVPAGSRSVEGTLTKVVPLFQGVVPVAQVMLKPEMLELRPRASMTAPPDGYVYEVELKIPYNVEQIVLWAETSTLASIKAPEPWQQVAEDPD
jgi:hypothetical protein